MGQLDMKINIKKMIKLIMIIISNRGNWLIRLMKMLRISEISFRWMRFLRGKVNFRSL